MPVVAPDVPVVLVAVPAVVVVVLDMLAPVSSVPVEEVAVVTSPEPDPSASPVLSSASSAQPATAQAKTRLVAIMHPRTVEV